MKRLIHLFGADGTGKTTISYVLKCMLNKYFKCVIIRKRRRSPLNDFFLYFIAKLSPKRVLRGGDGRIIKIYNIHKLWLLWIVMQVLGMKLWYIFRLYIPYKRGCIIILDRFIIDMIVADAYLLGLSYFKKLVCIYISTFCNIIRLSHLIHIDASINTIIKRRKRELDPLSYLATQRLLYNILTKIFKPYIVKTDSISSKEASLLILKKIFSI